MRGIITLAAAAGVPLVLANGAPFPGRAVIQTAAIVVTIGTLLIQGSVPPWISRRLGIDLSSDEAQEQRELSVAYQTAKKAPAGDFSAQRVRLGEVLITGAVEESVQHTMILRLDLEQAALGMTSEDDAR